MQKRFKSVSLMLLLMGLPSGFAMAETAPVETYAVTQQKSPCKGTVVDASGEPLTGASVIVKGTTNGAMVDAEGHFSLNAVKPGAILRITFIGYDPQEIRWDGEPVEVILQEMANNLGEAVVIGYGVAKKNDLSGSVVAIKPDEKNHGLITNAQDMIQGKIAGVSVINGGGAPGEGATIRVRGGSSLNASNDPLIVIDGLAMDNDKRKGSSNILSSINPQDIESFTVLKDASATAIYGSRGSNGVIIITTKKGRTGQAPRVSYNGTFGVSMNLKQLDVMNAAEYRDFIKSYYGEESTAYSLLGNSNTNWQDEIYQTALTHEHGLTLTGGLKNMPYRVSLGYYGQEGVLKTSDYERYSASVSLNPTFLDEHLKFNFNGRVMHGYTRWANTDAIGAATRMDPTQPVYVRDDAKYAADASRWDNLGGYFEWLNSGSTYNDPNWPDAHDSNTTGNPVSLLYNKENVGKTNTFIGNAEMDYQFHGFEDLRFHVNGSVEYNNGRITNWSNPYSYAGCYKGWNEWEKEKRYNLMYSAYLQYFKDFNDNHHFDIMGGFEWSRKHYEGDGFGYAQTPIYDASGSLTGYEQVDTKGKPWEGESYLASVFGRANYVLLDRYIFTATVRYDGSSRFSTGNKWGLFPSAAFAWRIKDEKFLKNVDWVSELKLRLGYGQTGQQDGIGNYTYFASYNTNAVADSYYPAMGNGGLYRPDAYNAKLTWETTTTYNVGLDFGIINNKLFGSVDAYLRKTTDLINSVYVAGLSNFKNKVTGNVGDMENKGVEVSLTYRPIQKNGWFWEISANATYNHNEITKTAGGQIIKTGGISAGTGGECQAHAEGHPRSSFYVYQQVYDENGHAVEGVYVDRNADGQITEDDRYFYKSPDAPWQAGLSTKLQYKNWDLGIGLRGSWGNYVYNDVEAGFCNVSKTFDSSFAYNGYNKNILKDAVALNWVTYDNVTSDYFVQNAGFVRLDNITLGYTFENFLAAGKYKGMSGRIYAAATNIATFSKYKGLDPEVSGGIDNNLYPRPFTIQLGLNVNF
ncbi:MAG: SusC/RagA family TonB-linked outer membrane protein [Alloprevotella sp.]